MQEYSSLIQDGVICPGGFMLWKNKCEDDNLQVALTHISQQRASIQFHFVDLPRTELYNCINIGFNKKELEVLSSFLADIAEQLS